MVVMQVDYTSEENIYAHYDINTDKYKIETI